MNSLGNRPKNKESESETDLRQVERCRYCGEPLIAVPVLACGHCNSEYTLRAFYYTKDNKYIAECIDLDLLTQGDSPEQAIGKLQEAMFGYLPVAFDGDPTGLVLRPAPLSHRLHYYWLYFKKRFKRMLEHPRRHPHLMAIPTRRISRC